MLANHLYARDGRSDLYFLVRDVKEHATIVPGLQIRGTFGVRTQKSGSCQDFVASKR